MKDRLKKSLAVLGITLGESQDKLSTSEVIAHLNKVSKSMSEALQECDERIEKASAGQNIDMIAKSFGDVKATLDDKFKALGEVMKSMAIASEEKDIAIKGMNTTMEALSEIVLGINEKLEGFATSDARGRSYTAQNFVEKSFAAAPNPDGKGIRTVSIQNKQAMLELFDELEGNLKKSSNESGSSQIAEMAATFEASGVLETEMYQALTQGITGLRLV